ncbi:hypothetical protein PABG_05954 [Paracoccidioides brasiliensis Pb03]|nr:hypothetical protein PABG_05954 [Paracoccidioides brasiliensis Pb03]
MQFLLLMVSMASIASTALAVPPGWSADTAKFYSGVFKEILSARKENKDPRSPKCDLSKAVLPSTNEPLPPVPEGQKLLHVTIGRGTQNYTCSSPSDKPKAIGAVATLFDVNCIASNYPYLLSLLPNIALRLPAPIFPPHPRSKPFTFGPNNMKVAGSHFFNGQGVPIFDLGADGSAAVEKIAAVDAPKGAMKGIPGQMNGAVQWLLLTAVKESTGKAKSVYRVNTAGGKAPATCEGVEAGKVLEMQYATEYWFYG